MVKLFPVHPIYTYIIYTNGNKLNNFGFFDLLHHPWPYVPTFCLLTPHINTWNFRNSGRKAQPLLHTHTYTHTLKHYLLSRIKYSKTSRYNTAFYIFSIDIQAEWTVYIQTYWRINWVHFKKHDIMFYQMDV